MKSFRHSPVLFAFLCCSATIPHARAQTPSPQAEAISEARRWAEAKFAGRVTSLSAEEQGQVLPKLTGAGYARKNLEEHPFLIAGQGFADGVAMRSPGEVEVQEPSGIARFEAVLGVDSNGLSPYSNAGRGSVVASIRTGSRELYRSPVLHEGVRGIPVSVNLKGAKQFTLKLEAVGPRTPADHPSWDQADWANARLVLQNGKARSLSDLPVGPIEREISSNAPFSFRLDGRSSSAFLPQWPVQREQRRLNNLQTEYRFRYTEPRTALTVRGVAVVYDDYPAVEWTLYFRNDSVNTSGVLEAIRPIDVELPSDGDAPIALYHSRGSMNEAADFQPQNDSLPPGSKHSFSSAGGRPTDGDMPYWHLAWAGHGLVMALGWPGQWDSAIARERPEAVHVSGGQSGTHFRLLPGEEVRTPLVVLQFWKGDWLDGQNTWRRWMIDHNLPRPGGKLPPPMIASGTSYYTVEMQGATEENQKAYLSGVLSRGLPVDHWWMDAGWYPFRTGWPNTGTWEVDAHRFPHGLKPITDLGHQHGVKSILWFEPERVTDGTWLATKHPEWLIGRTDADRLLNLGNPDAWHWLVEHVSKLISEQGIDVYRQDFNFEPLPRWQSNDTPDRQGITEIKHVGGYLAYFDELRRRFPNLLIDTCASGGRRLDLETLRRAVPLWRSDYPYGATPMQLQTYGLALWVPYFGTASGAPDAYTFRSQMTPATSVPPDPNLRGPALEQQLHFLAQWREVSRFYYADFFPLTEYNADESSWVAWQWSGRDGRSGMVQAFRHESSPFDSGTFRLRGLLPGRTYVVEDLDSGHSQQQTGKDLLESGLRITIASKPGAVLLRYRDLNSKEDR